MIPAETHCHWLCNFRGWAENRGTEGPKKWPGIGKKLCNRLPMCSWNVMACPVFQLFIDKTEDIILHLRHKIWSKYLIPKTTWDVKTTWVLPCTESELIWVTDLRGTVTLLTLRGLHWGPAGSKRREQEAWSRKLVKLWVSYHKNWELAVFFIRKKIKGSQRTWVFRSVFLVARVCAYDELQFHQSSAREHLLVLKSRRQGTWHGRQLRLQERQPPKHPCAVHTIKTPTNPNSSFTVALF